MNWQESYKKIQAQRRDRELRSRSRSLFGSNASILSKPHWTANDLLLVLLRNRSVTSIVDEEAVHALTEVQDLIKSLPKLTYSDLRFFRLIATGKASAIKASTYFQSPAYYDMKLNEQGYSIWHVAIHRQEQEIIELLLPDADRSIWYDLLLHAIQGQNISVVKLILNWIENALPDLENLSYLSRWQQSQFSYDITPIILSALIGNYRLIKFFYQRGEIFVPLYVDIPKLGNIDKSVANDMTIGYTKLHEYQVLTSPEMICYRTNTEPGFDPILEMILMYDVLEQVRNHEHELEEHYITCQQKIKTFLKFILDECKTEEMMELLLIQKEGYNRGYNDVYPRLMLALERDRHEFVTHPHCQKMLHMRWAGNAWPEWKSHSNTWKFFHIIFRIIFLPFICVWLSFDIFSKQARFLRIPINKYLNDMASDVYVLILLAYEAIMLTLPSVANKHTTPSKPTEILLMIFVTGHLYETIKNFLQYPSQFFTVRWNCFECLILVVFYATFTCWGINWYHEYTDPMPKAIQRLSWGAYDPILLGQTLLAAGIVLYYGSFLRYFQIHYIFGPLQLKLTNIVDEIFVFVFFFLLIVFAFAHSLYFIYNPFLTESDASTSKYASYLSTITIVFSSMLGNMDPEAFEQNGEHIGETVGKFLWMVYYLVGTTILVLMFLAYAVYRFREQEEDTIWKWNRSKVLIYYIRQSPMPSPFNLIPSINQFSSCFRWLTEPSRMRKTRCSITKCCYVEDDIEKESSDKQKYDLMVIDLTQRYLRSKLIKNPPIPSVGLHNLRATGEQVNKVKKVLENKLTTKSTESSTLSFPSVDSTEILRRRLRFDKVHKNV